METTGLASLDRSLDGILPGDNIVWHVDEIAQYQAFVTPYVAAALAAGRRLLYFRFARHAPLLAVHPGVELHTLNPEEGFEVFIHRIHRAIGAAGLGAYYVFDCLSDLATDWSSDAMLGNFFMLTCPYLYQLETVTYFGLLRRRHTRYATEPVQATTQLFIDVFGCDGKLYVRPIKTQFRYSSSIHLLHVWDAGDEFRVVRSSAVIAKVLTEAGPDWAATEVYGEDVIRLAGEMVSGGPESALFDEAERRAVWRQLVRMMVTRDESAQALVERYLTLDDLLRLRARMIGTGLVGGKTIGMLVARRIVALDEPALNAKLEPHDSFYIGSDVFYTFLVRNGLWAHRETQHSPATFLDGVDDAQSMIRAGSFPDHVVRQFEEMLDYFGQYPVIVRSSSLLEDNFGNAFAGKYDSVFCANQGTREHRMSVFLDAVRTVYASTMSREALQYRARHKLLERDEQMALLVMRVTGAIQGRAFYPDLAGVGFSYNPFVWSPEIDPHAGVLRLVYGLGTRAVDRVDDDYTRVVALNAPLRRPEADFEEICRHSQRRMDYIDLEGNTLATGRFDLRLAEAEGVPLDLFTSFDETALREGREIRILTFEGLLSGGPFVGDMRQLLQTLAKAYERPVDIEFAVNFLPEGDYRINLLQCRPLQVQGTHNPNVPKVTASEADTLLSAHGALVGHSRVSRLDWVLYVVPQVFGALPEQDRHAVARAVGKVNRALAKQGGVTMAVGPGRWGTHMASLGVPVGFSEISEVAVICEIAAMHEFLTPDVSLGSHFFGELDEMNMLYFALFPDRPGNRWDAATLETAPNHLAEVAPEAADHAQVLRLLRADDISAEGLWLVANAPAQEVHVVRKAVTA
jgi:hypothetical protein